MAKNIGIIKISGKVGNLQFFQKDGKSFVGMASSISKDRIKKDPAFKRTRENMAEFGGSASVSKAFRENLIPLKNLIEKNLHRRLTSVLRKLINLGSGDRGKRAVEFTQNHDELEGFELNESSTLGAILVTPIDLVSNADRNQLTLTINEFLPVDYVAIPEGATHFKVYLAGLAISDFAPSGISNKYKPLVPGQNGLFDVQTTAPIDVSGIVTGGISLVVDLPTSPVLDPNVALVGFVGVEFLQEVNGTFYVFSTNNAVRIEKLF